MNYYLDGKLIAWSVVDVIQEMICSLFFFYDKSFHKLNLGIYSVIKEIQFVQQMRPSFPNFRYFNFGSFVRGLSKVEYKLQFKPFQLLCPFTYKFVDYTEEVENKINSYDHRLSSPETEPNYDITFKDNDDLENFCKENLVINLGSGGKKLKLKDLPKKAQKQILSNWEALFRSVGKIVVKRAQFLVG